MTNKSILQHCHVKGIPEPEMYDAYKVFFGTLVSQSRLRIINLLRTGKKNVSQIMEALNLDQTNVSHDLARLRRCGFVVFETKGKFRDYRLNEATIKPLMQLIDDHMTNYCIHILRGETA